jgi:hypothetical protein
MSSSRQRREDMAPPTGRLLIAPIGEHRNKSGVSQVAADLRAAVPSRFHPLGRRPHRPRDALLIVPGFLNCLTKKKIRCYVA